MNEAKSPRVLVLAMDPGGGRRAEVSELAGYFLNEGAQVDLVTAREKGWDELDERVRLHQLRPIEARHPLPWLERALVIRAPRLVSRPVKRLGPPGAFLDRVRSRISGTIHRRLFLPFYKHVRPLLLARLARRRVLPRIDMSQVERVVVADRTAMTLGWRLARKHKDLTITTRRDKDLHGRP
ncbi:hypothetical protein Acsp03_65320 [Actinomadura sp. NBRC 104412]|nr:hypothetical protein Acsp03_65320 [Actinomadura sp. NBRC 104412]